MPSCSGSKVYLRIETGKGIREIKLLHGVSADWEPSMALAWRVFQRHEAPSCPARGVESFLNFISGSLLRQVFLLGRYRLWVAKDGEEIVGLVTLREHNHISLLFVDDGYQGKGVGRALVACVLDYLQGNPDERYLPENEEDKIADVLYERDDDGHCTVHAALGAVPFYQRLGFTQLCGELESDGIAYIPMAYGKR